MCEVEGGLNDRGSIAAKELVTRVYLEEKEQQHLLMRLREKIKKKLGKRDRYMKELYDYLAASSRGEAAGAEELCDLFEEFLKVDLAEAEVWDILHMMNFNGDGAISLDDFMAFMGPQGLELLETKKEKLNNGIVSQLGEAIVDVKVSTSSSEELTLGEQEYDRVEPNISGTTGKPVYLWYKRWNKHGGGARLQPIVDFLIDLKSVNSALVVDGYQCIQKNLNSRSTLSRPKYLWIRRATSEEEGLKSAIEDIAITTGKAKDRTSKIHNPPCGVFVHVPGNLNGSILNEDVFLWYKPVKKSRIVNGKRVSSFLHSSEKMAVENGFHLSSTLSDERRREELRKTIRRQLRQHFLNNSAGCVDYAVIFNKFDTKGRGKLKRVQVQKLLSEVGLNLDFKELNLFMGHIDAGASHGEISRDDFLRFVQLTEDELDGVCKLLRKRFGISKPLRTVKLQRERIKELRCQYESLDADGDGVLSHKEFANIFEVANIFLTAEEVESIRNSRFDIDGDGRVDFLNFLQFFFSKENKERRSASRVSSAVDVLRSYILSLHKPKEQGQNAEHVDSTTGWMEIRKRHMTNHRYFNGHFVAEDIEMALKKLNIRLSQREIHQTVQCIAPLGNGRITEQDFHQFACTIPRSIGELLKIAEKIVLPMMIESYRRLCHSRMRQVHQKRNIGRTKSSSCAAQKQVVSCSPSSVYASTGNNTRRPWSTGTRNGNKPRSGGSAALQGNVRSNSTSPFHASQNPESFWKGNDTEKTDIWNVYTDLKEHAEIAMKCNDEGFTTVGNLCNGLCENDKHKSGKNAILNVEWVILSQFVGADIAEKYLIDGSHLLKGICMAVLDEDNGLGGTNLEEMLDTNEEALNLVCEDLIKTIQDEARLPDGSFDYSKPFTLFDENGDGIIPIDKFRNMLYRLNVDIPLREKQIVELMNRFDMDRSGFISLKGFEAFAERYTWTQNDKEKISKQGQTGATICKVNNNIEDCITLNDHPSRFEGYLVTSNRASDAFVIGVASSLRASCASQQVAAKKLKQYFSDLVNITTTAMVAALDRAGLVISNELDANHKAALQPLCLASGLLNTTELIGAILKAWRILSFCELHVMGTAISGSKKLDQTLANIQAEILASVSTNEHVGRTNNKKVHAHSIESVFNSIDDNGDGFISPSQLQEGFKLLGFESYIKYEELRCLFRIFDPCEDGKISYIELCDFLQHGKFEKANSMAISASSDTTTYRRDVSVSDEIDLFAKDENFVNEFDELFQGDKKMSGLQLEQQWKSFVQPLHASKKSRDIFNLRSLTRQAVIFQRACFTDFFVELSVRRVHLSIIDYHMVI